MKILFLTTLYDRNLEDYYLCRSKTGLQGAANTFQWNLIDGMDNYLEADDFTIFNTLPVGTYPKHYSDLIIKSRQWSHRDNARDFEIGFINLLGIKQITRYIKYKKAIIKWIKSNNGKKSIVLYSLYLPLIKAIIKVKKEYPEITTNIIVTDIEGEHGMLPKNPMKAFIMKQYGKSIIKNINSIDSFVLLTEKMKIPLKIQHKPYIVVEGISQDNMSINHTIQNSYNMDKKIILYTGTLSDEYGTGVRSLLEAFGKINDAAYELWICGSSGIEKEIIERSKIDTRIKFFGYVSKSKVLQLQQQATVLINPRINEGEYVKYSFPSKTMEYMASGKPVIMYKLDGVPDEYDEYLLYVKGNSIEALRDKMVEVCTKSDEELYYFGQRARNWVLKEKNCIVQAKKIINMLKKT